MTTEILYTGDLHTEMRHIRSGQIVETDAPVDNKGKGAAFSPTDTVAAALGSCLLTTMGIKANDAGLNMDGARAEVTKIMSADAPRRIARLEVEVFMPAKPFTDKEKQLLEATGRHCPVARSLHSELEQVITFHW